MATHNDTQQASNQQQTSSQKSATSTSLPEIIVGIIGLLLVLATIGFLVYQGLQSQGPPDIVIEVTDVVHHETSHFVEITVTNRGGQTAAGLVITGELMPAPPINSQDGQNPQPVESTQITFDFVPPRSWRQGGLIFRHNPLDYDLELHAGGFTRP